VAATADEMVMEARESGSDGVMSSALPRFDEGDVLLIDAPARRLGGARTCRAVIESIDGDTVRVVVGGGPLAGRAAAGLDVGMRVWTVFQHHSGVFTFATTVAARVSDSPLRLVLRLPGAADQLDERRHARRAVRLGLSMFVPGDDGFEVHHTVTDDLGGGGFSCPMISPLAVGDEVGVSIELPEGPLDVMARVVGIRDWDLPDSMPRAHLEFIDLPEGHTERVRRVVASPVGFESAVE
jgi:PilZ domain